MNGASVQTAVELASSLSRLRVLVVDDDPACVRSMSRALSRRHQVEATTDPREALRWIVAEGRHYDVVLSDFQMPAMSGCELVASIRDFDPALARRVVFVSGSTPLEHGSDFNNPWLSKPFELAELERVILAVAGL